MLHDSTQHSTNAIPPADPGCSTPQPALAEPKSHSNGQALSNGVLSKDNLYHAELELLSIARHHTHVISPACKTELTRLHFDDPVAGCMWGACAEAVSRLGTPTAKEVETILEQWSQTNDENAVLAAAGLLLWRSLPQPEAVPHESARQIAIKLAQHLQEQHQKTWSSASVGFAGEAAEQSPIFSVQPQPITVELRPVPPLPLEIIPAPLRDWLCDIAERMSCPLEYPVVAALVAAASLLGLKVGIRPKKFDSWLVVANLWGGIVGPPGVQKTPATEEAMRPLERLVAEAIARHSEEQETYETNLLVAKAKSKAATTALTQAARAAEPDDAELQKLARAAVAPDEGAAPILKRYIVNDPTIEALGERLRENPNGLLLRRDELKAFLRNLDKPGRESDRAFYLEAWNGTLRNFTSDRIGRGTIIIPFVCLSLFGTIQPGPLARYLRGAASGDEADGLVPRFQLLVYPDVPPWKHVDRRPNTEAKNRAYAIFQALDALRPLKLHAQADGDGETHFLHFASDAQELFNEWWENLETTKLRTVESSLMQAHLAKYRSLMPSLALLFHVVNVIDGAAPGPVSLSATEAAAAWCDFLEQHARRIYQCAFDGDPEAALQLADRLTSLPNPFTVRQVVQKGWAGLDTTEDVERAVNLLEEKGWLQSVEIATGGRPTTKIWINPAVQTMEEESAQ